MNRVHFTQKLVSLLSQMIEEGERPILDYVKRGQATQKEMYATGRSMCDGILQLSQHQSGKAADIYFTNETLTKLTLPEKGFTYWHKKWLELGGKPMISWDKNHFE